MYERTTGGLFGARASPWKAPQSPDDARYPGRGALEWNYGRAEERHVRIFVHENASRERICKI